MICFWLCLRNCIFCISWPLPEALSLSLPSMFMPPASLVTWFCQCPWCAGIFTGGPRVVGAIATSRVTSLAPPPQHWCQVPCGCRCCCIQQARVTDTTSRGTTRWSGAVGSVASAMGLGSATLPLLFPWFHRLYVKNPLTFTCTTLCMSGVPMCWVEKNLVMHNVIYKLQIDGERQRECLLTP